MNKKLNEVATQEIGDLGIDSKVAPVREEIDREKIIPARKRDIALWLLTGGRHGQLWIVQHERIWKWGTK